MFVRFDRVIYQNFNTNSTAVSKKVRSKTNWYLVEEKKNLKCEIRNMYEYFYEQYI